MQKFLHCLFEIECTAFLEITVTLKQTFGIVFGQESLAQWNTRDFNVHDKSRLDLKNAFGELDHNLITSVLQYDHVPDHIRSLIGSI